LNIFSYIITNIIYDYYLKNENEKVSENKKFEGLALCPAFTIKKY
jgi:hypothetical protein